MPDQASAHTKTQERVGEAAEREVVQGFTEAYSAQGRPRVVLFLNRELDDAISDWRPMGRIRALAQGSADEERKNGAGGETAHVSGAAGVVIEQDEHLASQTRDLSADESWVWGLEQGFVETLERAPIRLLDRATITRLAALEEPDDATTVPSAKRVEMSALKEHADLVVEVLVTSSRFSPRGHEFKATAKETGTGVLLASVTSLDWPRYRRHQPAVVATSRGYVVAEHVDAVEARAFGRQLAVELMSRLAQRWGEG